jgi:hypothetical protein
MKSSRKSALAALALGLCVPALAGAIPAGDPVDYQQVAPRDFPAVVAEIERGLSPGGAWHSLTEPQKSSARKLLATMSGILADGKPVSAKSPNQQVRLFNAQEELNALLTGRPIRDRMECSRVKVTGSRIGHEIRCEVVAIDEDRRRFDSDFMRRTGIPPLRTEGVN